MDPFARASSFFSQAFDAQANAANQQVKAQRAGMQDARYDADQDGYTFSGPVPPQSGPYGDNEGPISASPDFLESMKSDMLAQARAKRRAETPTIAVRAGNGINTAVR